MCFFVLFIKCVHLQLSLLFLWHLFAKLDQIGGLDLETGCLWDQMCILGIILIKTHTISNYNHQMASSWSLFLQGWIDGEPSMGRNRRASAACESMVPLLHWCMALDGPNILSNKDCNNISGQSRSKNMRQRAKCYKTMAKNWALNQFMLVSFLLPFFHIDKLVGEIYFLISKSIAY
jgi:hypothetical protein